VEDGAVYEVSPAALALSEELARVIARQGGAALVVDYGYAGGALGETLQAVRDHRFAGMLDEPGETDLSAHVDFLGLAEAAKRGGAKAFGPVAQGALLESLGIGPRGEQLQRANPGAAPAIADAIHRLVDPDKMGTLFKALAILPPNAPPPSGF
jgi:SAM-dependent MidA family methyltransferase